MYENAWWKKTNMGVGQPSTSQQQESERRKGVNG
jgi:hypothetical protein